MKPDNEASFELAGIITVLNTPFTEQDRIDVESALKAGRRMRDA